MLDELVIQQSSRNILAREELKSIISAFGAHGIDVIVLKGAAFCESIYDHIGQRKMGDLDLLVRENDKELCGEILKNKGYRALEKSQSFYIKDGLVQSLIDLDHKISYVRNEEELWTNRLPLTSLGKNAFTLAHEENLIYLCFHTAVMHGDPGKKWIEDIARFARRYGAEIDWQLLTHKTQSYRLEIPCYFVLAKAKEESGSPVPEQVLSEIKPRDSWRAGIFAKIVSGNRKPVLSAHYFLPVIMQPGMIFRWAFPSRRFMQTRYRQKPPLLYVYYLLRPFQLLKEGITAFLRLISRR